jgi:hypothetical protein
MSLQEILHDGQHFTMGNSSTMGNTSMGLEKEKVLALAMTVKAMVRVHSPPKFKICFFQ